MKLCTSLIFIRIDGTKWKVLRWCKTLCKNIKESGFSTRNNSSLTISLYVSQNTYPTLGSPTIPTFSDVPTLPNNGVGPSATSLALALLIIDCK